MAELPSIKEVIKKYGLAADKKLGQNFLFDQNITDRIVRNAGNLTGNTVVEIGPGPGILTRSILASGAKQVIALEKDTRCINALEDYLVPHSAGRLRVIEADALKADEIEKIDDKVTIIANLPYNISTELLTRWLDNVGKFNGFTLMFQREVAMRIAAKPRTKDYGRLSIKAQLLCDIEHNFDIPPEAFYPPPKVTSSVITLTPKQNAGQGVDLKNLDRVCKAIFGQRRKSLRSSLKQLTKSPADVLEKAGIDGSRRPEELSVEEMCTLAGAFNQQN